MLDTVVKHFEEVFRQLTGHSQQIAQLDRSLQGLVAVLLKQEPIQKT
jgi:hypothetical protein